MEMAEKSKSRREVILFFTVTITLTWLLWIVALLIKSRRLFLPLPFDFFLKAGSFVPSVVGLIFAYILGGRNEVRLLLRALLSIHVRPGWLLFALFVVPGVSAVSCLIYSLSGGNLPQPQFELWFIPVAFVYILIIMGPLGEEAGWRGFALKRMLCDSSPMKAAVLLGIVWALWHLPLFFISGTTQNALTINGLLPALLGYLLYTVMISVLITLLYVKSNGSVLGSILLHTMGNLSLGIVPLILSKSGGVVLLAVLGVTSLYFIYRYRKTMFGICIGQTENTVGC